MPKLFVEKSVEIDAPAASVWNVLTNPGVTKEWIKEFSAEFTLLDSDWKLGSTVLWKNANGKPHVEGKVTAVEPYKKLRFGIMPVGELPTWEVKEDDGITYILTEKDGKTLLSILHGDFGLIPEHKKYYDVTVETWDRVLPQIKNLAEWMEKLKQEGFTNLRICPIEHNINPNEHTHGQATVHVILRGELVIADHVQTKTFIPGDRVDFIAGTRHKAEGVKAGSMIVGMK